MNRLSPSESRENGVPIAALEAWTIRQSRQAVIFSFEKGEFRLALELLQALFGLGDTSPAMLSIGVACLSELGESTKAEELQLLGQRAAKPDETAVQAQKLSELTATWLGTGRNAPSQRQELALSAGRLRPKLHASSKSKQRNRRGRGAR